MGLFDFLGNVVSLPFKIAGTTVETTVKTTGHFVTGEWDELDGDARKALKKLADALEDISNSVD